MEKEIREHLEQTAAHVAHTELAKDTPEVTRRDALALGYGIATGIAYALAVCMREIGPADARERAGQILSNAMDELPEHRKHIESLGFGDVECVMVVKRKEADDGE